MAVLAELTPRYLLANMKCRQPEYLEHTAECSPTTLRIVTNLMLDGVVATTASLAHHHLPSVANRHQPSVVDYDISLSFSSCFCTSQHQSLFHKDTQTRCEDLIASPSFTLYNGCPSSFARGKSQQSS